MKTKLLLAVATMVGFSSTSAIANPRKGVPPSFTAKASAPAKPAFKSCCDTKTRYTTNGIKNGIVVNKSIVCNTGCDAPHAGKNCTTAERTQCAD
jgi:hypothetical protein